MWRKIQELGLAGIYKSDEKLRKILKLPQILAFVPAEDVPDLFRDLFNELKESTTYLEYKPALLEFYQYFEKYYVGSFEVPKKKPGRQPRVPPPPVYKQPVFDVAKWSVYSRILDQISRTNNFTEAWHNAFSSILGNHPLIYSLVDSMRKEQKRTEDNLLRLRAGIVYKRKPHYVRLDEQLIFAVKSYSKESFSSYYDTINSIVSY